ncbi:hypothetical protein KC320_g156 [Hortaea werneckii]|nr:hypothetical protein KC320_g156 [Hortaea werneckii]
MRPPGKGSKAVTCPLVSSRAATSNLIPLSGRSGSGTTSMISKTVTAPLAGICMTLREVMSSVYGIGKDYPHKGLAGRLDQKEKVEVRQTARGYDVHTSTAMVRQVTNFLGRLTERKLLDMPPAPECCATGQIVFNEESIAFYKCKSIVKSSPVDAGERVHSGRPKPQHSWQTSGFLDQEAW